MRNLTFGAIALATLIATGSAFAADEPSRNAADAAAEQAAVRHQQPLGYANIQERAGAFANLREPSAQRVISQQDALFLAQGDRGIGND
ncbi:hypothetical protein ABLE93_26015 [Xanthobacter sp. KR7-65]|uniref:hypothetical protein n=1 Tax=Xanthobacter sp. KR7-65 TaxID=3156612 RepID=UPI0032B51B7B